MYINALCLSNHLPTVVNEINPFIVTSCGNYRVKQEKSLKQNVWIEEKTISLYITSRKGYLFIDEKNIFYMLEISLYMNTGLFVLQRR